MAKIKWTEYVSPAVESERPEMHHLMGGIVREEVNHGSEDDWIGVPLWFEKLFLPRSLGAEAESHQLSVLCSIGSELC